MYKKLLSDHCHPKLIFILNTFVNYLVKRINYLKNVKFSIVCRLKKSILMPQSTVNKQFAHISIQWKIYKLTKVDWDHFINMLIVKLVRVVE